MLKQSPLLLCEAAHIDIEALRVCHVSTGLILVSEPYFNEARYEKQRGTQHGQENSRMYNEMAILKLVQVSYL